MLQRYKKKRRYTSKARYFAKKRARYHIELFFHYEKHYLLITQLLALCVVCVGVHDNQFVSLTVYTQYFDRTVLTQIIPQMVDIDTQ